MLLRLRTFGGLWIENPQAEVATGPRPRSLALLAICAAAGAKGVSRERALGVLWPNSHPERARHALSQTLYYVRREAGAEVIVSSPDLRLDPRLITSDVDDFLAAIRSKNWADAAALYTGTFLDGFYLSDAPEFERWVDNERSSLAADATRAFESAAKTSLEARRHDEAIDALRRLTRIDPANSRFAARYMEALADAGDRAGAVAHGKAHLELLQREFELDPDAELEQLIARLRESAPSIPRQRDTVGREPSLVSEAHLVPIATEVAMPSISQQTVATVAALPPVRRAGRFGARRGLIVVATAAVALAAIAAVDSKTARIGRPRTAPGVGGATSTDRDGSRSAFGLAGRRRDGRRSSAASAHRTLWSATGFDRRRDRGRCPGRNCRGRALANESRGASGAGGRMVSGPRRRGLRGNGPRIRRHACNELGSLE